MNTSASKRSNSHLPCLPLLLAKHIRHLNTVHTFPVYPLFISWTQRTPQHCPQVSRLPLLSPEHIGHLDTVHTFLVYPVHHLNTSDTSTLFAPSLFIPFIAWTHRHLNTLHTFPVYPFYRRNTSDTFTLSATFLFTPFYHLNTSTPTNTVRALFPVYLIKPCSLKVELNRWTPKLSAPFVNPYRTNLTSDPRDTWITSDPPYPLLLLIRAIRKRLTP